MILRITPTIVFEQKEAQGYDLEVNKMAKMLTEEQRVDLATLMIMMGIPKEECLEVLTAIDTSEELSCFWTN